jgi:hypothetical protein
MQLLTRYSAALHVREAEDTPPEIVSVSDCGSWILRLPPDLKDHQHELERLLFKVFNNLPKSPDNVALAKQMSINWCVSKCKQNGLRYEDCLASINH